MNLLHKILNKIKELIFVVKRKKDIKLIAEKKDIDIEYNEEKHLKKDYFLMYKNIKKGIISIDNLMLDDLIKVMMIMDEEVSILDRKIEEDKREIIQMNIEMESLMHENNTLKNYICE